MSLAAEEQDGVERLILNFDGAVPPYHLERKGPREVQLYFLGSGWGREVRPPAADVGGKLLASVSPDGDGLRITLASDTFNFSANATGQRLSLDFQPNAEAPTAQANPQGKAQAPQTPQTPQTQAQQSPAQQTPAQASGNYRLRAPAGQGQPEAASTSSGSQVPQELADAARAQQAQQPTAQPAQAAGAAQAKPEQPKAEPAKPAQVAAAEQPNPAAGQQAAPQASAQPSVQPSAQPSVQPSGQTPAQAGPEAAKAGQEAKAGEAKAEQPKAAGESKDGHGAKEVAAKGEHGAPEKGAKAAKGHGGKKGEDGKEEPLPWDELYAQSVDNYLNGKFPKAIEGFKELRDRPELPPNKRPEVLHNLAQATYAQYRDDLSNHFPEVSQALEEAINGAPESPLVPKALLQLGLTHLHMDNLPEAKAYLSVLRKKYPKDPNTAYIDYYFGDYYLRKEKYKEAAESFQKVIQSPGESPVLLESSFGLAKALDKLEYYPQAYEVIEFIGKRWPRFYVDNPEFLRMSGELANHVGQYAKAKDALWLYYNLNPGAKGMDVILARLGDLYSRLNQRDTARMLYDTCAQRFPDEEGGLVAQMRLAEEGIYDGSNVDQVVQFFDTRPKVDPEAIYNRIVKDFPKSPLAPLAQLKLAMWQLYSGRPGAALASTARLPELFPDSDLKDKAAEVGAKAFTKLAGMYGAEHDFKPVVDAWNSTPAEYVRDAVFPKLSPETRLVLATGLWQAGQPQTALALAEQLYGTPQAPGAVALAANIRLQDRDWPGLLELAKRAEGLKLPDDARRNMDYSLALALQQLDKTEKARPLWQKLAGDLKLDPQQRGYALYYLSGNMGAGGDLRQQYLYAQESLSLLSKHPEDRDKVIGNLRNLIDITKKAGRFDTSLALVKEYEKLVREDDPEWPALRFKLAELYQAMGDEKSWTATLTDLRDRKPDSLQGRMAASALSSRDLDRQLKQFNQSLR